VIRARAFSGRIEYQSAAPADSKVEVVVPTDSLEVLTPPDTEEIRKVTATMRTDVLDVAHYPEIRLTSRSVELSNGQLRIVASLTIKGVTGKCRSTFSSRSRATRCGRRRHSR